MGWECIGHHRLKVKNSLNLSSWKKWLWFTPWILMYYIKIATICRYLPSYCINCCTQGWGQIHFNKYKYIFFRVSNTNTNTLAKIWSNTSTNTAHQIQIHTEVDTKMLPFYRWHIQIHSIVRKLFYLFKISLKIVSKVPICNEPALVQIMAWHWVGNKPLSDQWWPGWLMHECITQPKWINVKCWFFFECGITPVLSLNQWSLVKQKHVQDKWLISSCVQEISLTKAPKYLWIVSPE